MDLAEGAVKLYSYLLDNNWDGTSLKGPDAGIRLNLRLGRFIKSYLDFFPWMDDKIYIQAQCYWILDNWLMDELQLADSKLYKNIALLSSEYLSEIQTEEGFWDYPEKGWRKRVATGEGNYGAIALAESYRRTGKSSFLNSAIKWYDYLIHQVGFKNYKGNLSVNYFSKYDDAGMVPNITASTLRMFATLKDVTNNDKYLEYSEGLISWLNEVQLSTGELPYEVFDDNKHKDKIHYLCYNYNAFQFLNLSEYYKITLDSNILLLLNKLALFLVKGLTKAGMAPYNCNKVNPIVIYYSAAIIAAIQQAAFLNLGSYESLTDKGLGYILSNQKKDGNFLFYSKNNYLFFKDSRTYPRNLSMILYNLLSIMKAKDKKIILSESSS